MGCPITGTKLRPELEALPARMQHLPVDKRGYVVPWFVDWINGEPEFRAMNQAKWVKAINFRLCWVCGGKLGRFTTFVAGPMCGINRTSAEPPSHLECAQWSARNCPFLNNPEMVRRPDDNINFQNVAGFSINRNPGVSMLWTTKEYSVFQDHKGKHLITFGEPESVEWYACGRAATRAEVQHSIETGLPALVALASREKDGLKYLTEARTKFEKYLPK